jgi:Ni/Co efflux regulator RcnB
MVVAVEFQEDAMKRLLLAAAAVSCLAGPALSAAAQDRGDRGDRGAGRNFDRSGRAPDAGQTRRGVPNPNFQPGQQRQARPDAARRPDAAQRPQLAQRPDGRDLGQRRDGRGPDRGQFGGNDRDGRDRFDNRNDNRNDRFDNRNERFDDRNRFGSNGRYDRNDNRGSVFSRSNPNWWRGRPEFRGYNGARNGYWFFPSYGYIRPEPRFYGYSWRNGDFVPPLYRQYVVVDPFLYGLDWPPPGYQWVYIGNSIVLMDRITGRIVQVAVGVF